MNITSYLIGNIGTSTKTFLNAKPKMSDLLIISLKFKQFQNEFMKSSFLPKYERKIVRISALCSEGRNLDNFLFVFWERR